MILSQQYADGLEEGERGKEPRKILSGVADRMVFHFLKWENWGKVRSHENSNLTHNRSDCASKWRYSVGNWII